MAEPHLTCSTPIAEIYDPENPEHAVRDAGRRILRIVASLRSDQLDQASITATTRRVQAALKPLSRAARARALEYARACERGGAR